MTVQYDGTDFAGFQVQVERRTVQGVLEAALGQVTGEDARMAGAGRTDSGVHALGQVISFETRSPLKASVLQRAMNAELPEDVVIVSAADASPGFHARFSARSRAYRYRIWNGPQRLAIGRQYVYSWRAFLDAGAMDRAAALLVGRHDFAAFAGASRSAERPSGTVRTLFRLHCWREDQWVQVEAVANAFLPRMVRNLVGTLLLVGSGRLPTGGVEEILASGDRRRAGRTAPAKGLCLTRVQY
ncbi:MAG: tRNA pseudouridine(38-40) synthase TruA [Chloroflexota bacterium]